MDLSFHSLFLLISFTVLCVYFSKKYLFQKHTITKLPLPPGTTGWPLVGETPAYLSLGKKGVPERFIEERKNKYSPKLFKTSLIGQTIAIFGSAEGNKFMFSNEHKLLKFWVPSPIRNMFPISETDTDPHDENKMFRSMIIPHLKPDALRSYVTTLDSATKEHLKQHWSNNQEVKVQLVSRLFTFTLACRMFLNVVDPGQVQSLRIPFIKITTGIISVPINIHGTNYNRGIRAVQELREKIVAIIKQRKIDMSNCKSESMFQDVLSRWLLQTNESSNLVSESDTAQKFIGFLLASNDTTATTITAIVYYLAKLPHVYDKVLTEQMEIANSRLPEEVLNWEHLQKMRYSWNVACEALRLCPPFPGTYREAITDFTYEGFLVPKGMKLHCNVNATHRDPKYFPDPDKFDPARFEGSGPTPYSYIPFGGGAWMCPGKEFVRLEILTFMHHLLTMFRFEMVFPEEIFVYNPLPVPQKGLQIRLYPLEP